MSSSILLGVFLLLLLFTLVYGIQKKNKTVISISAVLLLMTLGVIGLMIYVLEGVDPIVMGVFLLSLLFSLVYGICKKHKMVIGISAVLLLMTLGVIGFMIYALEGLDPRW